MSAIKKKGSKVAVRKPARAKKNVKPAAKAKKPAKKPAVKPKKAKVAVSPAPKKAAPVAQQPAPRKSFFSFLGFGAGSRATAGKTKMTDLIKK